MRRGLAWTLALGLAASPAASQTLTEETCSAVREHVLPSLEEQAWRSIPWIDTLAAGVLEADARKRPLLIWVMNGHPLGAT